jgi:hypothetical protein
MTTTGPLNAKRGASLATDPAAAVRELHEAIGSPDAALVLVFCSADYDREGLERVLTVARGVDLVRNLEDTFARVEQSLGVPSVVLGFDCILRSLEADTLGLKARVGEVMADHNVSGFATYGEQFSGMHVNHTFTAIALAAQRLPAASEAPPHA